MCFEATDITTCESCESILSTDVRRTLCTYAAENNLTLGSCRMGTIETVDAMHGGKCDACEEYEKEMRALEEEEEEEAKRNGS